MFKKEKTKFDVKSLEKNRSFLARFAYDYVILGYSETDLGKKYNLTVPCVIKLVNDHNLGNKRIELENYALEQYLGEVQSELSLSKEKVDNVFGNIVVSTAILVDNKLKNELNKSTVEMEAKDIKLLAEAGAIAMAMAYRIQGVPPVKQTKDINVRVQPMEVLSEHLRKQMAMLPAGMIIDAVNDELLGETEGISPSGIIDEIVEAQEEYRELSRQEPQNIKQEIKIEDPFAELTSKFARRVDNLVNVGGDKQWLR